MLQVGLCDDEPVLLDTLEEKVRIAKEKGISYGKLLEMIERLGGRNESNIEKSPAGCRADTASDGR